MSTGTKILSAVFIILAVIGTITYMNRNQETDTTLVREVVTESFPVRVTKIAPKKVVQQLNRIATIEAGKDVTLNAEVSGRIKKIHLSLGDTCKKGDVLVSLEKETYQIAVMSAKATLSQAEVTLNQAQKTLDRTAQLRKSDVVSAHDADVATTAVESARSAVEQARAGHRLALRNLKETKITCPFNGRVAQMLVETGQSLGPGTSVARIVDTDMLELTIAVSSTQLSRMTEGQKVLLTPTAFSQNNTTYEGTVAHLGVAADANTGLYPVEVSIDNTNGSLRPGMVMRASSELGSWDSVLAINADIVLDKEGEPYVFVVKNNTARQRSVQTGERVGDELLIQDGIKAGETVVVSGQDALVDGSKVSIIAKTPQEAQ
ncbi:MAG: efflux RND transporter periplasmic adaptor subunit [Deltaproteobacteria bacterium]|nr:efflux RND transporter periplasmic adaptor subunit [Deltaproteobacteria bacterium]